MSQPRHFIIFVTRRPELDYLIMLERSDPFYSPKKLISDAENTLQKFLEITTGFLEKNPFDTTVEPSEDGLWIEQKIVAREPVPDEIEKYARQTINDARHALDQAMYVVCGNNHTYFPIGKTEQDFENAVKGRVSRCPERVVDVIREYKPYYDYDGTREGNYLIWALNRLSNESKHGMIVPVPLNIGKRFWDRLYIPPNSPPIQLGMSDWNAAKGEMVVNRFHPNAEVNFSMRINVGFNIRSEAARMDHIATEILPCMFYVANGVLRSIEAAALAD